MALDYIESIEEIADYGNTVANSGNEFGWIPPDQTTDAIEFMHRAANAIMRGVGPNHLYFKQAQSILDGLEMAKGVETGSVQSMTGVLFGYCADLKGGLLNQIQSIAFAEAFDDFLDIAQEYAKEGKLQESAILASAVLEDTIKRVELINGLSHQKTLDPAINALASAAVVSKNKAKLLKAWAGVRTSAFHARWSELDIADVKEMISGLRDFIENQLGTSPHA